jgi:DNA polymerase-4
MNSFYASVECLYNPGIRHLPVAVCGDVEARHGIVLAKNEPAKRMGVKTGDTVWQARQKCPGLQLVAPNFSRYQRFSRMANELYAHYTDRVEPFGIDESWLDLSGCVCSFEQGVARAHEIRTRIFAELGVTVSIGVCFNKVFAKLCSDLKKPNAVTAVDRASFQDVLHPLPCEALLFVGRATRRQLRRINIHTIGDIAAAAPEVLSSLLGKWGRTLHRFANGMDESPVARYGESAPPKGVGNSTTLPYDIATMQKIKPVLYMLCESVSERMRRKNLYGQTLALGVRYSDLSGESHQSALPYALHNSEQMAQHALRLLNAHWTGRPIRSIGVRMTQLSGAHGGHQLTLFEGDAARFDAMDSCVDSLRARFGHRCIARAVCLTEPELYINPNGDDTLHSVAFVKQVPAKKERHYG